MRAYYEIIEVLKDFLRAHESITTVRLGDISEVDLEKQTLFPLAQIIVGDTRFIGPIMEFNIKVLAMDIVFQSNENPRLQDDSFTGIDNRQDVFNTMLQVVNSLQNTLKRGSLFKSKFQLNGEPVATAFSDDFGNLLTGWSLDFNIRVPNVEVGNCDYEINLQECSITFDNNTLYTFDNN